MSCFITQATASVSVVYVMVDTVEAVELYSRRIACFVCLYCCELFVLFILKWQPSYLVGARRYLVGQYALSSSQDNAIANLKS
mmetsp:Transcript_28922/g.35273  ORF Transcript_28922/g.35273 Transcript_28922/m.35273 type:complete len:83 (-) Transcript_28922:282-530(-)